MVRTSANVEEPIAGQARLRLMFNVTRETIVVEKQTLSLSESNVIMLWRQIWVLGTISYSAYPRRPRCSSGESA